MKLSGENVFEIFTNCLFEYDEPRDNKVEADGILLKVGFHPERLESHRQEIQDMLSELPDSFKVGKGGGMSFLDACNNKDGKQWTGLHRTMEQLFLLGLAIGKVKCILPREIWPVLPGGVPYYSVED